MKPVVKYIVRRPGTYQFGDREIDFYVDLSLSERIYLESIPLSMMDDAQDIERMGNTRAAELEAALSKYVESAK